MLDDKPRDGRKQREAHVHRKYIPAYAPGAAGIHEDCPDCRAREATIARVERAEAAAARAQGLADLMRPVMHFDPAPDAVDLRGHCYPDPDIPQCLLCRALAALDAPAARETGLQFDNAGSTPARSPRFGKERGFDSRQSVGGPAGARGPGDTGQLCICTEGGPGSYEGPVRDCPTHGEQARETEDEARRQPGDYCKLGYDHKYVNCRCRADDPPAPAVAGGAYDPPPIPMGKDYRCESCDWTSTDNKAAAQHDREHRGKVHYTGHAYVVKHRTPAEPSGQRGSE